MKRFASAAIALTAAVTLTGCAQSAASGQTPQSLVWTMWVAGQADVDAWQQVADAVPETGGPEVTLQGSPFNDYWTKLGTQLSLETPPCLVSVQSLRVASFTEGLMPLDDLVPAAELAAFDPLALEGMRVDGQLYGLPYDTGPMLMFYNAEVFAEAGIEPEPGWDVADFEAAAATLAEQGTPILATSMEDLPLQSTVLGYNGARLVGEDGRMDLADPDFAAGLDWIGDLVDRGYALPASGTDPTADDNAFITGRAAAYVDGPWGLITQKEKAPFEIGVATIPSSGGESTFAAGSGFGIAADCPYPEQAAEAVRTMTSEPVLTSLAEAGRALPGRTAVQPVWLDSAGVPSAGASLEAARDSAVPLPGHIDNDRLTLLFGQYGVLTVNGGQPGAVTLAQMADQLPEETR